MTYYKESLQNFLTIVQILFLHVRCYIFYRIDDIPPPAFQDLHSLEWVKLYNNKLKTLHYELMEPVLDSLMHIDIHSKFIIISDLEFGRY